MKCLVSKLLILSLVVMALLGCGGGNGSSKSGSGSAGTGSGGSGGTGTGGTITEASRKAAMNAVGKLALSTSRTDRAAYAQTLLAAMKQHPEFVKTGITDAQSIWGTFADGLTYIIFNDRSDLGVGPAIADKDDTYTIPDDPGTSSREANELPANKRWLCLNYFQNDPMSAYILQHGNEHNYQVFTPLATLDAFRSFRKVDVGTINAHGVSVKDPVTGSVAEYYITTNNIYEENPTDPVTKSDKAAHYLAIGLDPNEKPDSDGNPVQHWAINSSFAIHYWTFRKNSMLYLACCDGMDYEGFRKPLLDAKHGLDLFVAWYNPVLGSTAEYVGQYAYDRMLGGNNYEPLPYGVRAMRWLDINAKIISDGQDHDSAGGVLAYEQANSDGVGVLSPSIQHIDVDELNHQITMRGWFGSTQGTVTVGGQSVDVSSWKSDTVVCNLPADRSYVGDVVATLNKHKSNAVPLTEIHAKFTYLQDVSSFHSQLVFDTYVRLDIHRYRDTLADSPLRTKTINFVAAPYSTATFTHSGSVNGIVLSGSGTLPYNTGRKPFNPSIRGYIVEGSIDTTTSPWTVTGYIWFEGADGTVTPPAPGKPESWSLTPDSVVSSYPASNPPLSLTSITFNLDPDTLSMTNSDRTHNVGDNFTHTMQFQGLPANDKTVPKNTSEDNAAK